MASEPTSALSFYDLILRVAREAGIARYGAAANERATIPIDAHDFDLCKQIVNDGIRMFIADAPPKGWRWQRRIMSVNLTATRITGTTDSGSSVTLYDATLFETYTTDNGALVDMYIYVLTGTGAGSWAKILNYDATSVPGTVGVTEWLDAYGNTGGTAPVAGDTYAITGVETVGGDITRYPLAENFGGEVDGPIEYEADSNHGTDIQWCDESRIRARQAIDTLTGYPKLAAIRPLEFYAGGAGPKRRFELILDKEPSAAEVVEFPYTLFFDELRMEVGDINTPAADSIYDDSIGALWPNDYFNDWVIHIMAGRGRGNYAVVTDYTGASGKFDITKWLSPDGATTGTTPNTESVYYVEPATNLHPAGFRFDQAILAACLAQAEIDIEDVSAGFMQKYTQKALPKAYAIDVRNAPRKLGKMNLQRKRYFGRQGGRSNCTTAWDL